VFGGIVGLFAYLYATVQRRRDVAALRGKPLLAVVTASE
jgi:hypothetical protein